MTQKLFTDALAGADRSFADTGDVMEALGWVAFAAKAGAALPPRIGAWLHAALTDYTKGAALTMDEAMGLAKRGKAQPRRKAHEAHELQSGLGRMMMLCAAGAIRKDAAVLVSSVTRYTVEYLSREYGASRFPARESQPFSGVHPESVATFVRALLAEYPDGAETEQEKVAILQRHAIT